MGSTQTPLTAMNVALTRNYSDGRLSAATELLLDIVGGEAGPGYRAVDEVHIPTRHSVTLRASRIERLLGRPIDAEVVERPNASGYER